MFDATIIACIENRVQNLFDVAAGNLSDGTRW